MTVAGVGDLLAALTVMLIGGWRIAWGWITPTQSSPELLWVRWTKSFWIRPKKLKAGTLESMGVLAKLIALGGLAMSLSHATAPMSGYEHVTSHVLDLVAEQRQRPLAQHGTQVALATLLTTGAYQTFFEEFEPEEVNLENCYPTRRADERPASKRLSIHSTRADAWLRSAGQITRSSWKPGMLIGRTSSEPCRTGQTFRRQLQSLVKPPQVAANILHAISSPPNSPTSPRPHGVGSPICISQCSVDPPALHAGRYVRVS